MPKTARVQSPTSQPAFDETRQELVKLMADVLYIVKNHTGTVAPGCATATTTSQAKTANNTTYVCGGKPVAKNATDNLWTLAGTLVAVSSFQKYLLLLDGSGTASVQEGVQAATAAAVTMARPADGKTIIGVLTVATDATHTFTPGTTLLGAAGITATFIDGFDDIVLQYAPITL